MEERTMTETYTLAQEVAKILGEILEREIDPSNLAAGVMKDHGADSMDIVDLVERLERCFSIIIPHRDVAQLVTVGDIVTYVAAKRSQNAASAG
jgi:acyl carrier protein